MGKIVKNVLLILLILTLSASTVLLAYLHFGASKEKELSGEWAANLDMTQRASAAALDWLQDIEGVSISLEDMESYMQGLTVQVQLTFEQTNRLQGAFSCNVLSESYEECNQAAYEAFAAAFLDLLAKRLHMAGYTDSAEREVMEALVNETFGMSAVSYLMTYGPALLPSLEDLQTGYDGSGTYAVTEDLLTRHYEDGGVITIRTEHYIRKDSNLILYEKIESDSSDLIGSYDSVMYTLKKPEDGKGKEQEG